MDDFTSALYLGFHHAYHELKPWRTLTSGVPAALREPSLNGSLAGAIAGMQGLERGVLAPSSLHLFWDLMGKQDKNSLLLADAGIYKIGSWGLERASCQGARVVYFKHHCPQHLALLLQKECQRQPYKVLVLTDGWCPHCGQAAPLPLYLDLVRKYRGLLLIDDSQALGILGKNPTSPMPYGEGGGGLLQWFGLQGSDIVTICSLAKGLGVPLSVMSSSASFINTFVRQSETRVHCSPVSAAHVQAALHALKTNRKRGSLLRQKLLQNIRLFQKLISGLGLSTRGDFFPLQSIYPEKPLQPHRLYLPLAQRGIRTLLLQSHVSRETSLSFCFSATHTAEQIRRLAAGLAFALNKEKAGQLRTEKRPEPMRVYPKPDHHVLFMQYY